MNLTLYQCHKQVRACKIEGVHHLVSEDRTQCQCWIVPENPEIMPFAPRLTQEQIEACIVGEDYHVFPGTTSTVCCLKLKNGYTVIGESACVCPANFDAEIGRKIARENAKEKIWALEGYLLRQRLHELAQ